MELTSTELPPELLTMARECAVDATFARSQPGVRAMYLSGRYDRTPAVRSAILAIIGTTERAAQYVTNKEVWDIIKQNDADTSWHQAQIAENLRNNEHLK